MFCLLAVCFLASTPLAQPATDFDAAWNDVARGIRSAYYARETRPEKVDQALTKHEAAAKAAQSREQFVHEVRLMMAEFGESHFGIYTQADPSFYFLENMHGGDGALAMPTIGAWFEETSKGWVVSMVLDGGAALAAGLRKGDLMKTVDGEPFTPIEALRPLAASSPKFVFERAGQTLEAKIAVSLAPAKEIFLEASRKSGRILERGEKSFAYFRLWAAVDEDFAKTLADFVYLRAGEADGFILDLRGGFGGRPEQMLDPFFRPDVALTWEIGESAFTTHYGFGKPLVALVDQDTRSAKEVLAFMLKKTGRAVLLGTGTAGDLLGTFPQRVSDWAVMIVPRASLLLDGEKIEGRGVEPDFFVADQVGQDGEDLLLERAIDVLQASGATL